MNKIEKSNSLGDLVTLNQMCEATNLAIRN